MFDATFSRETRNGNKNTTFYGGPDYEVATPIDYRTDNLRLSGEYAKGRSSRAPPRTSAVPERAALRRRSTTPSGSSSKPCQRPRTCSTTCPSSASGCPPTTRPTRSTSRAASPCPKRHKITASLSTRQHEDGHGPPAPLDEPQPRDERHRPERRFTIVPPYNDIAAQFDTFMGQLKLTGDPLPLARLHPVLAQVRPRGQDRGVPLQQQRPGRRARVLQLVRLHPGAPWLGLGQPAGRGPLPPRTACASARSSRRRSATTTPAIRRRDRQRVHALRRLHPPTVHRARSLDRASTASRGRERAAVPPAWAGATQTDIAAQPPHLERPPHPHAHQPLHGGAHRPDAVQRVLGVGHRPPRPVLRHLRRRRHLHGEREAERLRGLRVREVLLEMAAAYIARRPPFDPANLWKNDTTDKVDTFRAGLDWVLVPDKLTSTRPSTTRSRAATRSTSSPCPERPSAG